MLTQTSVYKRRAPGGMETKTICSNVLEDKYTAAVIHNLHCKFPVLAMTKCRRILVSVLNKTGKISHVQWWGVASQGSLRGSYY